MHKRFFLVISILCQLTFSAAAQTEKPKQISAGVVNGNAISLAKPRYPEEARQANAEGAVNVQVTIDEEGNVVSATAVSGHPLLREAAQQAALQSKFKPTFLSGQAVKVMGVVVYNFSVSARNTILRSSSSMFNLGTALSVLETTPTLRYFDSNRAMMMLSAAWTEEQRQIQRLEELKKSELETAEEKPTERIIDEKTTQNEDGSNKTTVTTIAVTGSPEKKTTAESVAIGQSLISSIQGRLAGEPVELWYFNLGINFSNAILNADSRSKEIRKKSAQSLRPSIDTARAEIPKEIIELLSQIMSLVEKGVFTDQDKILLSEYITKISGIR